jgi:Protein of unknown function (DUF3307)
MIELLLLLIAGHYLADFPLQPDFVAKQKSRVFFESIGFHCLTAHAMIQGLVAAAIAGALDYPWLMPFVVVAITHWLIDFGKAWDGWPDNWRLTQGAKWAGKPDARGLYGINVDQALHGLVMFIVATAATI